MSTRAIYHFKDKDREFRVYKHFDGYPSGAYKAIENALTDAWLLPRFEAAEFACAFIAGNKDQPGGIRLVAPDVQDMGQEYEYTISCENGILWIEFRDYDENENEVHFEGTLEEMKNYVETTSWNN